MRRYFCALILTFVPFIAFAQNGNEDFQTFRKNMLEGFQGFRKGVLADYEKFLNGVWEEYQMFTGKKSNPLPKPNIQPRKKDEPAPVPQTIEPKDIKPTKPIVEEQPQHPKPVVPAAPSDLLTFYWCGMPFQLPRVHIDNNLNVVDKESLVRYFKMLEQTRLAEDVAPQLGHIANTLNFNDWCLCLLIQSYAKQLKADANANTRNMLCWYLMAQFGFDVRLAFNGQNLFYLIPFQQQVYGHSYIMIHDTPYYIWGEGVSDKDTGFYTPDLPVDAGECVNLVMLRPLNLPYKGKRFSHTFAGRTISGEVNENLIKVMNEFPQIPIPCYAIAAGDNKARKQVLAQMKQFIVGMSELEAANFLLQFVQSLDYATDDEQFGREKPFFFEETLYYPKCDCEDRAVFYHYLVTQLLGRDVHLVHFPNHECTAVNFSQELNADSYMYQDKQYVICDPTYIGASIGMCMPEYRNVKPEVEL